MGSWNQRKEEENDERMMEYPESAMVLDKVTSKYLDILRGVAQGCTSSSTLFEVFIHDLIIAPKAAKQEVMRGEDMVSGLMLADDSTRISEKHHDDYGSEKRERYNTP